MLFTVNGLKLSGNTHLSPEGVRIGDQSVDIEKVFVAFVIRADVEGAPIGGQTLAALRILIINRQNAQRRIGGTAVADTGIGINQRA